jgi:hypothetical protein
MKDGSKGGYKLRKNRENKEGRKDGGMEVRERDSWKARLYSVTFNIASINRNL